MNYKKQGTTCKANKKRKQCVRSRFKTKSHGFNRTRCTKTRKEVCGNGSHVTLNSLLSYQDNQSIPTIHKPRTSNPTFTLRGHLWDKTKTSCMKNCPSRRVDLLDFGTDRKYDIEWNKKRKDFASLTTIQELTTLLSEFLFNLPIHGIRIRWRRTRNNMSSRAS